MPELFSSPLATPVPVYGPMGQAPPSLHFSHLIPCQGSPPHAESHRCSPLRPAKQSPGLRPSDGLYDGHDGAERAVHAAGTWGCALCSSVTEKAQLKISSGSNCTSGGTSFLPCGTWGIWRHRRSKDHGVTCHPKHPESSPQFHSREVPALASIPPAQGDSALPTAASRMPFQELLTASILRGFCGLSSERNMQPPRLHNTIALRRIIIRHFSKTAFPKAAEGLLHL